MLFITNEIRIPLYELTFTYARSSGPGGQNVNKVNSKAVLHWNIAASPSLPLGPKSRFLAVFQTRISTDGMLVLSSDKFRDQTRNREDCLQKLTEMLRSVATPPKPRKKTKPSFSSKVKRKQSKTKRSETKRNRGRISGHD